MFRLKTACWIFLCFAMFSCVSTGLAEAENDFVQLMDSIPSSTAAVIQIRDPKAITSQLAKIGNHDQPSVQKLKEWIVDPEIGLLNEEEFQDILRLQKELLAKLEATEQAVIILHGFENSIPAISVACKVDTASAQSLSDTLSEFVSLLSKSKNLVDSVEFPNRTESQSQKRPPSKIFEVGEYKVFGNFFSESKKPTRLKRSLMLSRRFKRTWSLIRNENASILIYFAPKEMRQAFPWIGDASWKSMRLNQIVGVGCWIKYVSSRRGSYIKGKASLLYTFPSSGISKVWQTVNPLNEVPKVGLPFYELKYSNTDSKKRMELRDGIQRQARPNKPTSLQLAVESYKRMGLDYLNDVLAEEDEKLEIRYVRPEKSSKICLDYLFARKVNQFSVAKKLAESIFKNANRQFSKSKQWIRISDDKTGRIIYTENDKHAKKKMQETGFKPIDPTKVYKEAHILNSSWYVLGEYSGIQRFFDACDRPKSKDYANKVRELVEEVKQLAASKEEVYAVDVVTPLSWISASEHKMDQWVYRKKDFKIGKPKPLSRSENFAAIHTVVASMLLNHYGSQIRIYSAGKLHNDIYFWVDHRKTQDHIFLQNPSSDYDLTPFRYYSVGRNEFTDGPNNNAKE